MAINIFIYIRNEVYHEENSVNNGRWKRGKILAKKQS